LSLFVRICTALSHLSPGFSHFVTVCIALSFQDSPLNGFRLLDTDNHAAIPNSRIFTIKIKYNRIAALGGLIILPQGF
jgi:hypothetical protein